MDFRREPIRGDGVLGRELPADHSRVIAAFGALHHGVEQTAEQSEAETQAGTGEQLTCAFLVGFAAAASEDRESGGNQGQSDIACQRATVKTSIVPLQRIHEKNAGAMAEGGEGGEGVGRWGPVGGATRAALVGFVTSGAIAFDEGFEPIFARERSGGEGHRGSKDGNVPSCFPSDGRFRFREVHPGHQQLGRSAHGDENVRCGTPRLASMGGFGLRVGVTCRGADGQGGDREKRKAVHGTCGSTSWMVGSFTTPRSLRQ